MNSTNRRGRGSGRRPARSPELVERLERSRQRTLDRQAAAVEREKSVTAAVDDFLVAWSAIRDAERRRDDAVAELQRKIDDLTTGCADEVAVQAETQAQATVMIRALVDSDDEVADLLEITVKQARALLAAARRSDRQAPAASRALATEAARSEPEPAASPLPPSPSWSRRYSVDASDASR